MMSLFLRDKIIFPILAPRTVKMRRKGPAPRSRRLPFYPSIPVPVIRLRNHKYAEEEPKGRYPWRGGAIHLPGY